MTDEALADFASWVRDRMAERRFTQRALAHRAGINHASISRLLAGRDPKLTTVVALIRVLR